MATYSRKRGAILSAALVALGVAASANADTMNWTTTTGGTWQDPNAWSGATWVDGADAVFNASTGTVAVSITSVAPVTAQSLTVTSGVWKIVDAGTLATGGTTLTLGSGGVTINGTGNTSGLTIQTPLVLTGVQTWTNKASTYLTVSGTTDFGSSPITLAQGNIQFANSANIGSAPITVGGSTTTTLQAGADNPFGTGTIILKGSSRISSNTTAARTFSNPISVEATANLGGQSNTGTLTLDGPVAVTGNFQITSDCGGTGSANKSQTVILNGDVTLGGNLTVFTQANTVNTNTTIINGVIRDDGTPRNLTKTGGTTNGALGGLLQVAGANTYSGNTTVSSGTLQVLNAGVLGTGTLAVSGATGRVIFDAGNTRAQKFGGLSIGTISFVELNDNDMIVGESTPQATVQGFINTARNAGTWDGTTGLFSAAAKNDASHATTLGVLSGADYSSAGGTGTFGGAAYASTDSLVKYTYYGDTDFNGQVNFDDYVRTDNGFNNHLTGWLNGDFDGNSTVNFDDYVLIDLAFNTQTGTLGRALTFVSGSDRSDAGMGNPALQRVRDHVAEFGDGYRSAFLSAVPEPGSIGLLVAGAMLAVRRRRRA